ncbi:MAG: DUF3500 domain-containing protein [Ilumatobacteraceae bacterium]
MSELESESPRRRVALVMAEAAARLIDSLDEDQRAILLRPFDDHDERRRWFYTPTDHGGLPLGAMTPPQQRHAFGLLATGLSTAGYVTASTIIGLENVLDHLEGWSASWGRERGRDPLLYFVRIFGDPRGDEWAWRIGGHHVSVNIAVVGGAVVGTTPLFLGADPASAPLLGPHPLRPLEGVEDLARELVRSFDAAQRTVAVVSPRAPTDLVLVNRAELVDGDGPVPLRDIWRGRLPDEFDELAVRIQAAADAAAGLTIDDLAALSWSRTPKGLAATAMGGDQRAMLDALLRRYAERLPDGLADDELAKFAGPGLDEVHVLWAGGLEPGEPHYYRLHGPTLLAEYDNTARGANHVHTVWRDPRGDFADDAIARHRAIGHD